MHKDISVAVVTRHRPEPLHNFCLTFLQSLSNRGKESIPHLSILYDAPEKRSKTDFVVKDNFPSLQEVVLPHKSSLTELWNWSVMLCPTDYIFICNDDIEFKDGWLSYLEDKIAENRWKAVCLFNHGAWLFHKSLILELGWFDERFRGGGYEDNDIMLRISEAGWKHLVDRSHDFIRKDGNREVGHFVDHCKYEYSQDNNWRGENNYDWFCAKWGHTNWSRGNLRGSEEVDWHPAYTQKFRNKYNVDVEWTEIARWGKRDVVYI